MNTAGDGVVVRPFDLFGGSPGLPHRYIRFSKNKERL